MATHKIIQISSTGAQSEYAGKATSATAGVITFIVGFGGYWE